MLKQTYTSKTFKPWTDEQVLSSLLIPYFDQCEKCNDEKWCEPDDYRVEDGSFCSVSSCPLVLNMKKGMIKIDKLYLKRRDQNTFGSQYINSHLLRERRHNAIF